MLEGGSEEPSDLRNGSPNSKDKLGAFERLKVSRSLCLLVREEDQCHLSHPQRKVFTCLHGRVTCPCVIWVFTGVKMKGDTGYYATARYKVALLLVWPYMQRRPPSPELNGASAAVQPSLVGILPHQRR